MFTLLPGVRCPDAHVVGRAAMFGRSGKVPDGVHGLPDVLAEGVAVGVVDPVFEGDLERGDPDFGRECGGGGIRPRDNGTAVGAKESGWR